MNPRCLRFSWLLVVMALAGLAPAHGQQGPARRGKPIFFSEPKRDTVTSNLNQVATRKMSLENLENDLKRPFDIFDVADPSLRQASLPPMPHLPPPTIDSKRIKDLLEKKDWVFRSPDDYKTEMGMTAEEILKIPQYGTDGRPKKNATPLERYYERMDNERNGNTNQLSADRSLDLGKKDNEGDGLPFSDRNNRGSLNSLNEPAWKQNSGGDASGLIPTTSGKPRTIADLFGIRNDEDPGMLKAQEARVDEFKKMLDPGRVSSAADSSAFNPLASALTSPSGSGLNNPGALPAATSLPALPGSLPSFVGAPSQPLGVAGLAVPFATPPSPLPQPEARTLPPPVNFSGPKRKF